MHIETFYEELFNNLCTRTDKIIRIDYGTWAEIFLTGYFSQEKFRLLTYLESMLLKRG